MDIITYLHMVMDGFLMPFFRFPESSLFGYYLGVTVLSIICIVIGEYSISFAFRINRKMIVRDNNRIERFEKLSIDALKAGDKSAFKACNGIANEAFGKSFFTQITLSAASLWPLFFALGWMQYRFSEVEFNLPFSIPFIGETVGYTPTFLLCYIAVRIAVSRIRRLMNKKSTKSSKHELLKTASQH